MQVLQVVFSLKHLLCYFNEYKVYDMFMFKKSSYIGIDDLRRTKITKQCYAWQGSLEEGHLQRGQH